MGRQWGGHSRQSAQPQQRPPGRIWLLSSPLVAAADWAEEKRELSDDRSQALVARGRGWLWRCKEWLANGVHTECVHLEIKQGACIKKGLWLDEKHPSRLSWALSLESVFSLPSSAVTEGDIWNWSSLHSHARQADDWSSAVSMSQRASELNV